MAVMLHEIRLSQTAKRISRLDSACPRCVGDVNEASAASKAAISTRYVPPRTASPSRNGRSDLTCRCPGRLSDAATAMALPRPLRDRAVPPVEAVRLEALARRAG